MNRTARNRAPSELRSGECSRAGWVLFVVLGLLVGEGGLTERAIAQVQEVTSTDSTTVVRETVGLDGSFGAGVHLGWPVGLVLQWQGAVRTYDLLLAWELDDFILIQSHARLYERPFSAEPRARWYLGPGVALGARSGTFRAGVSAEAGLGYRMAPVDFFIQISPRLALVPTTRLGLTFGLGGYIHL